ncbi:MAG: ATP-binding protein [Chloroflexi bacterium]|nr:ATP-binding protein [Chloroflexota bacterium]
MLHIGRNLDSEEDVYINANKSRAVLICGKRGSGKSYTMGVLVEELFKTRKAIILIIDPMGIYHTMSLPNVEQERQVWEWGANPEGLPVKVLVPGDPVHRYGGERIVAEMERRGVRFEQLKLNPSDVSPEGWCDSFQLNINEPMGIAITKAVIKCQQKYGRDFFISQIIERIEFDTRASDTTKDALINRLEMAMTWDMFENSAYREVWETLDPNTINILDLSTLDSGRYGRRPLVVSVLCRDLFVKRSIARRKEELGLEAEMPKVWLFIDEAHQFIPSGKSSLSKEVLIQWVKEGRQPGLSLVVASQQPSAIDVEVLSQCDVILSHALTTAEDKVALNRLTKDYMAGELKTYINKIARTGQAVLVDDDTENTSMVQIKPRKSKPGGSEF